jgi:hypothetical protein
MCAYPFHAQLQPVIHQQLPVYDANGRCLGRACSAREAANMMAQVGSDARASLRRVGCESAYAHPNCVALNNWQLV